MHFEPHDYQRYCIEQIIEKPKVGLFLGTVFLPCICSRAQDVPGGLAGGESPEVTF